MHSEALLRYIVSFLVDSRDGRWDCGSSDGTREDAWFRALGYGSWDDNDDESYVNKGPIFVSDDGAGDYYFAETKGVDPSTPETSKTAFIGQINNKIKELTDPLSASEKKALKYQILSEAFFSENGCNAKKSSGLATDSGKDKLKIGEIEYIVNNDGEGVVDGEVAVGHEEKFTRVTTKITERNQ